jgi:predicted esterase
MKRFIQILLILLLSVTTVSVTTVSVSTISNGVTTVSSVTTISAVSSASAQMTRTDHVFGVIPYSKYVSPNPIKGVILYLHGIGEVGTNLNDLERNPIPKLFKAPSVVTKDYVIIAPQLTSGTQWSSTSIKYLLELCEKTKLEYHTDICILSGLSLGGYTGLILMKEAYTKYGHGHFFTAVGLMCARVNGTDTLPFIEVPIKLWHNTGDTTNPILNMRSFKTRITNAGGNVTLVESAGGHDAWTFGYQDANFWAFADTYGEVSGDPDCSAEVTAATAAGVATGTAAGITTGRTEMQAEAAAAASAAIEALTP